MTPDGESILTHLNVVRAQRSQRDGDPALARTVRSIKHLQHARFEATYADLLSHPRFGRAARFFLDDLYGPSDFSARDDQFVRIVPALVRLFPTEIVRTVVSLSELHALSERLDTAMAEAWMQDPAFSPDAGCEAGPDRAQYASAWRRVGEPEARERQIALMLEVGAALERFTRNPVLRHTLRLMRGPAQAAGLGALQRFLETGFETFREMKGASEFLNTVAERERRLARQLFDSGTAAS